MKILFNCNFVSQNEGVPGIYQSIISDLNAFGGGKADIYGSDYIHYYRFNWNSERSDIDQSKVEDINIPEMDIVVFSAFDPYRWMLPRMIKWKMKGATIVFWNWGYHTKQQCKSNWSNGKVPRWVKKIATLVKRYTLNPIIDNYLVSGKDEMIDSRLDSKKCTMMPMGRPQSAILDECDLIKKELSYENRYVTYIGRGQWVEKGLEKIVNYAKSELGKKWHYQFLISRKDSDFHEKVEEYGTPWMDWHFDVFGKDNLPWLLKSAAFITVNLNPTQIRAPYEALYSGTPIVVYRECFMDEFKEVFDKLDLEKAVQIVDKKSFNEGSIGIEPMDLPDRKLLNEVMFELLSSDNFANWFITWLANPRGGENYYQSIYEKIRLK